MPRCKATTKAGNRCKANAYSPDGKCIFHKQVGGGQGRAVMSYAKAVRDAARYRRRK